MPSISVSDRTLPTGVGQASARLLKAGCNTVGVCYHLSGQALNAAQLSLDHLSLLLKTGLPGKPAMLGVVHSYSLDKGTGDVSFQLNYDLTD